MRHETQVKSLIHRPFACGDAPFLRRSAPRDRSNAPSFVAGAGVAGSNSVRYSREIMNGTHATQTMITRPVEDGERGVCMAGIFRLLILPAEEAGPDLS